MQDNSYYGQLNVFQTIAQEGSISAAARKLQIAVPSASQSLKLLEQKIGVPLFHRTTRSRERTLCRSTISLNLARNTKRMGIGTRSRPLLKLLIVLPQYQIDRLDKGCLNGGFLHLVRLFRPLVESQHLQLSHLNLGDLKR